MKCGTISRGEQCEADAEWYFTWDGKVFGMCCDRHLRSWQKMAEKTGTAPPFIDLIVEEPLLLELAQ